MVRVRVHTDAGTRTGAGHLMRCCALAAALSRLRRVQLAIDPRLVEPARAALDGTGVELIATSGTAHAGIGLVDLPEHDSEAVSDMKHEAAAVVCISDAHPPDCPADVVIQPNLLESEPAVGGLCLRGPEFILLHPAFEKCEPQPLVADVTRVLFCFGGGDEANISMRVPGWIRSLARPAQYRLALGAWYPRAGEVLEAAAGIAGVDVLQGLPTLAQEIAACDLAVVAGGTLLYETCATGRPTVVIAQNAAQSLEAGLAANAGAVLYLGQHSQVTNDDIVEAIRRLWEDAAGRRALGSRALATVRPGGAARAAERLVEQLRLSGFGGS